MKWQSSEYPTDGTWCWVSDGIDVWIAARYHLAAGGWTNQDTWEDFDGAVVSWLPLETPYPLVVCEEAAGASIEFDAEIAQFLVAGRGTPKFLLTQTSPGIGVIDLDLLYHVTLTPVEPETEPATEPVCPVCGAPASEHRDGLFCCPLCKGEAELRRSGMGGTYTIRCSQCLLQTPLGHLPVLSEIWNRRA